MTKVAMLGIGAMGSRMANTLLKANYEVVVYNRTLDKAKALEKYGAKVASTPLEAAKQADIVISMVTDDTASREVWLTEETGAIHGLRPGSVAIETSTLSPKWINELADKFTQYKLDFLDAPVAGSRPQAEAGQLIYFVGGKEQVLNKARSVLSEMSGAIHHVGPTGSGIIMKLAVNSIFGIQVAAFAEILGMVEKYGIETADAVKILESLPTTSPALKVIANQMAQGTFSPLFPISLVEKDFRYVSGAAGQVDASVPASDCVLGVFSEACREGLGPDNISGVVKMYSGSIGSEQSNTQQAVAAAD